MLNEPFDAERPEPTQSKRTRVAWVIGAALIAAAVAAYWFNSRALAPPPAPVVAPAAPDTAAVAAAADAAEAKAAHELSAAGEGADEKVRREFSALSPRPEWQMWLAATPDLIDSGGVLIANVADDDDPRRRLTPLRPQSDFQVAEEGGRTVESAASARRYDLPVEVLASLDVHALAPLWRTLHPLVSVAYHAVGRPGVSLNRAAGNALKRITSAQISEQQMPVEKVGKLWLYTDPDLEKRGNIEKLLQRMGGANAHKLQAKAAEIRAALALP